MIQRGTSRVLCNVNGENDYVLISILPLSAQFAFNLYGNSMMACSHVLCRMAKGVNWKVVFVSSLSVRVLPAGNGVVSKMKGLNLFPDLFEAGALMVGQAERSKRSS